MNKKFEKSEIEVIKFEASDIIATSEMINGDVPGSANYATQSDGMSGGTVGGVSIFDK